MTLQRFLERILRRHKEDQRKYQRACPRCGVFKPLALFGKRSTGKPRTWCRECEREDSAARRKRARAEMEENP